MKSKLSRDYNLPERTISIRISNELYFKLKNEIPYGFSLSDLIRSVLVDYVECNTSREVL